MITRNLKPFIKHLLKNKIYTTVTIVGFAVSLAFVILLGIYIKNELSVNMEQKNKNRIYRVCSDEGDYFAPPVGQWVQNSIPEIESFTRIYNEGGIISKNNKNKLRFQYLLADSTFFNIFTFNLIEGNKETALKTKNSIVLSQEMAHKLFGNESPIGKQIMINMDVPCVVSGVVEDISKNSFFKKTDAIINFRAIKDIWGWNEVLTSYGSCSFALFFMAKPNANLPARTPDILKMFKKDFWPYKEGLRNKLTLEPLPDVYFSPIISGQNIKQNSKTKIIILSVIVLLKLVLAIINYLNLTIAQAGLRAKEVALKKLHGSSRQRLIILHVTESVLLCLSAFFIALFLSFFAEPLFNKLLDTKLNLHEQLTGLNVLLIALAVVFIGFLSGVIPALVITRLKAVDVIKGGFTFKTKTLYSKILIVFQYTVVIVLISASIVIGKQTQYMLHKNPGYNTKNIIMFENVIDPEQKAALRDEFMKVPGVKAVSYVAGTPVDGGNNYTYNVDKESYSFQVFNVDSDFFKMIGLKITPTGAAYTKDGIWINQFAVKKLGLDFLPKSLHLENHHWTVLGVVNNFNFRSLHQKIGLAMITQMKQGDYPWSILVQIESENMHETAEKLKKVYMDFTEDIPVEYEFFDSIIQSWYEKEQRTAKVIQYFAFLAIIISVMGIFAMSMFFNQQKAKEIGIRRVNGASVNQIVKMLNISFVKLVVTAFVLSVPLAYYFMDKWLQNFAYRIRLSWWIFVVSGLIALLVALITVSWQIIMTARQNPAEILKYE